MVQVIEAKEAHCEALASRMRVIDRRELLATCPNHTPQEVLLKSLELSMKAFSVEEDSKIIAMFGVTKSSPKIGIPWLLASDEFFENHSWKFMRQCKEYFEVLIGSFDYLFNFVAVENTKAIRWLEWLGFTIERATLVHLNGLDFYKFYYRKK